MIATANASALADTYAGAAEAVNGACGAGYVADVVVGLSGAPRGVAAAAGSAAWAALAVASVAVVAAAVVVPVVAVVLTASRLRR